MIETRTQVEAALKALDRQPALRPAGVDQGSKAAIGKALWRQRSAWQSAGLLQRHGRFADLLHSARD